MPASRRCNASSSDIVIVDVDAHHYENEHYNDIPPFMENDVSGNGPWAGGARRARLDRADECRGSFRTWAGG
jgi:hypothetical protein